VSYKGKEWCAHRLIYTLMVGPIPEGTMLLHKSLCGESHCVNPDHLILGDIRDGVVIRGQLGRTIRGEAVAVGKLYRNQVREIRRLYESTPKPTMSALARQFGVTPATIRSIVYHATWRHLDNPQEEG
jgi:hypothetical protein